MYGLNVDQWRALPWWQERLYTEWLIERQRRDDARWAARLGHQQPAVVDHVEDEDDDPGPARYIPLSSVGANVTRVQFG